MFAMSPLSERRRQVLAAGTLLSVAIVAGCSSDGSGDTAGSSTSPPAASSSLASDTTTTTIPTSIVTTGPTATAPPTTAAPTADPNGTSTLPASSAPAITAATTTTEPIALQELILTGEGLGSAQFGADPDQVIEYVTSILGGNTGDTGWVDPFTFASCEGTVARRVDWGALSLLFTDLSPVANGRPHFIGYEYGRVGQIGDDPVGLHTPGGITLGSRVVDLLAEFPEATINPGEPEVDIPDNFYVSTVFYGLLTGVTPDDYVTVLFGGYGCFE